MNSNQNNNKNIFKLLHSDPQVPFDHDHPHESNQDNQDQNPQSQESLPTSRMALYHHNDGKQPHQSKVKSHLHDLKRRVHPSKIKKLKPYFYVPHHPFKLVLQAIGIVLVVFLIVSVYGHFENSGGVNSSNNTNQTQTTTVPAPNKRIVAYRPHDQNQGLTDAQCYKADLEAAHTSQNDMNNLMNVFVTKSPSEQDTALDHLEEYQDHLASFLEPTIIHHDANQNPVKLPQYY